MFNLSVIPWLWMAEVCDTPDLNGKSDEEVFGFSFLPLARPVCCQEGAPIPPLPIPNRSYRICPDCIEERAATQVARFFATPYQPRRGASHPRALSYGIIHCSCLTCSVAHLMERTMGMVAPSKDRVQGYGAEEVKGLIVIIHRFSPFLCLLVSFFVQKNEPVGMDSRQALRGAILI